MDAYLRAALTLYAEVKPDRILLLTDSIDLAEEALEVFKDAPTLFMTSNRELKDQLREAGLPFLVISGTQWGGVEYLTNLRDMVLHASIDDLLQIDEKLLILVHTSLQAIIVMDVGEIGVARLKEVVEERISLQVLEAVLTISSELVREGREGSPVGACFVLGDTDNVMKNSRQLIMNPFSGHPEEARNLTNPENWETIKEFAQIDGAFVINEKGLAVAAGRYIGANWDVYLQGGLGGRHLAAASISKTTKAVAVTVSTSGVIRIFRDGKVVLRIGRV